MLYTSKKYRRQITTQAGIGGSILNTVNAALSNWNKFDNKVTSAFFGCSFSSFLGRIWRFDKLTAWGFDGIR